ncbi:MAG: hypothetical protein QXS23_00480 [Desulfurococcaceae archaeon]
MSATIGIQPAGMSFDPNVVEKKFVVSIAGAFTKYIHSLAFFDTGVIDITLTTLQGTSKIADISASGRR